MRPSSGAASTEQPEAPDIIAFPLLSNIAAPEDGRTPPMHSPAVTDSLLDASGNLLSGTTGRAGIMEERMASPTCVGHAE